MKNNRLHKFMNFWLPLSILTGLAILSSIKIYKILSAINNTTQTGAQSDIRLATLKSEAFFYILLVLAILSALIWIITLYRQNEESKELIVRVNWTIERLANLETKHNQQQTNSEKKWPWGNHHTEALGHMEAAAKRFWAELYDPTDPSTAPTNEMVERWLVTERGVSKQKAAAIASILRLDGLRTGPR